MIGGKQLSLPCMDLTCANPHCRATFSYDRTQPAKKYCGEACRTLHNNALIAARHRAEHPPNPETWERNDPTQSDSDWWMTLAGFAGGTDAGSKAYLEQYQQAVDKPRNDRRKRYQTEE